MAAVLLFWNTNMAAVTSCENPLCEGIHLQFRLFALARRTCLGRAVYDSFLREEFSVKMGPTKPKISHNLAC